jgi:hypothetical protein
MSRAIDALDADMKAAGVRIFVGGLKQREIAAGAGGLPIPSLRAGWMPAIGLWSPTKQQALPARRSSILI